MKAIVLKAPQRLELVEIPDPVFEEYEALCRIEASAVCGGTDRHIFNNDSSLNVNFPVVIGHEAIGRVVACGKKVKYLKSGDLISRINNRLPENCGIGLMWGGMAELGIAVDWQSMKEDGLDENFWRKFTANRVLPEYFDPISSTMIITWRETLAFIKKINLLKGEKVVIIGSGAVALSFVCHCRNLGVKTVVIGNMKRKDKFISCGANFFVSYKEKDFPSILKESFFSNISGVIDAYGDYLMLNRLIPILNNRARVGLYGLNSNKYKDNFVFIKRDDISFYDGLIYDEGSVHDDVIKSILIGDLRYSDFISPVNIYRLNDYEQAFKDAWSGDAIKSVINFLKK